MKLEELSGEEGAELQKLAVWYTGPCADWEDRGGRAFFTQKLRWRYGHAPYKFRRSMNQLGPFWWPVTVMKIFGIGLHRTGTSSLAAALHILGYRTLQTPVNVFKTIDHPCLEENDAFTDLPIPLLYKELDQKFPGSKFICTIRDVDKWLASVKWLFSTGRIQFNWRKTPVVDEIHEALYGVSLYDADVFRATYFAYYHDVRLYFEDRSQDLLMMNFSQGEGWDELCLFLNKEIPIIEFPRRNTSSHWRTIKVYVKRALGKL